MNKIGGEFRTRRLHHASYLHAACVLKFLRVEMNRGRAEFVFEDPGEIGPETEVAFDRGALVPAVTLFSSVTFLRRQIDAAREVTETGESHHEHASNVSR